MVFGWGKNKQENIESGDKKPDSENKISINEINSIIINQKEKKKKWAISQAQPCFSEIQIHLNSIFGIIDHLKNDNLKVDDIDKTLKVLVVRSKTEVIDVISKESKIALPKISTYDDVVKTSDLTSHTLKKIGDVLGKHSRVIHVFAKKYAQDLKDHLAVVTKNHLVVSKLLSELSLLESTSIVIKEKIEKILSITQEINDNNSHIIKLQESYAQYQNLSDSTQKNISLMVDSSEHKKFAEYNQQLKQIKEREEKLGKEIDNEFSKISRPLGKYVYVTSLDKEHKLILEKIVERPSQVINMDNKNSIISILESCMKGIMSGTVSVKETDKSIDHMTHVMHLVDDFISKKNRIELDISNLKQKLVIFDSKRLDFLEKQLDKTKSDKEDAELKIKNLTTQIQQKATQKENLIGELENLLESFDGTKYKIVIN